jgi:hypothetical protein
MEETKSGYIGSATLLENFDSLSAPPGITRLVAQTSDIHLQEVLRDFAVGKMFRRDIFRRGTDKPMPGELAALLDEMVLTGLYREQDDAITLQINGTRGRTLNMDLYRPALERLRTGPYPVAELRRSLGGSVTATQEVIAVLCAGDFAHPTPSPQPAAGQEAAALALNRAISLHNRQGGALTYRVAPMLGTALFAEVSDIILCEALAGGVPGDLAPVAEDLGQALVARGLMRPAGISAAEQRDRRKALLRMVDQFVAGRAPLFQRCGVLA